jgi:ABC-2 type transport system permease protein
VDRRDRCARDDHTRCRPDLRWFAENQPFTPFIETLRGLLMGTPIGNSAPLTLAWCALLTLAGYLWAMKL